MNGCGDHAIRTTTAAGSSHGGLTASTGPQRGALQVLFGSHLEKENEQILPRLAGTPGVSVAQLLAGMHELLG